MKWEVLSSAYLTEHPPYFVSRKDVCKKPDGTSVPAYYVVELPPAVVVFALVEEERVLMIRQYRHPVGQTLIELPGGFIDPGETALDAAKRELLEETGYSFSNFEYLGQLASNPGILNNFTHIFFAKDVAARQEQRLERSEQIDIALYSVNEVFAMLKNNEIIQSLHVNACFYAMMHMRKLTYHERI